VKTAAYTDLVVPATFGWGKPPGETVYTLHPDGRVEGGPVPQYLYSTGKADLRTTPRFRVNLERPGRFLARVQQSMGGNKLRITLDGKTALEQDLPAGPGEGPWKSSELQKEWNTHLATYDREFGIDVPAGAHEIVVENAGGDWLTVSDYRVTNYRSSEYPEIRAMGLQSGRRAVLWMQDERSNWKEAQAGHEPRTWRGVRLLLPGLPPGRYRVYWWDTRKGNYAGMQTVRAGIEGLTITAPNFRRDIAADIQGGAP
jgi:hypothetical protein